MKHLRELMIAVLLVGSAYLVWDNFRKGERLTNFVKTENVLKARMDSIITLQHIADLEAIRLATELGLVKKERQAQAVITELYRMKYEKAKHTPVRHLSDSAINSEIARLYGYR